MFKLESSAGCGTLREFHNIYRLSDKPPGFRCSGFPITYSENTLAFITTLRDPVIASKGSLKFLLLADDKADVYPRFAPTMEWDAAAANALLIELGMNVMHADTNLPLTYNKENLLNPFFKCWP